MSRRRWTGVVMLVATVGCRRDVEEVPPSVKLLDLAGSEVEVLATREPTTAGFVFVSTQCPISNRYAPTLTAITRNSGPDTELTLVYPDPDDAAPQIAAHREAFSLDLPALRDPEHRLVAWVGAKVTPEAAVVRRSAGGAALTYVGRIDDRAVSFGTFKPEAGSRDLADALDRTEGGDATTVRTAAIGCYIADLEH